MQPDTVDATALAIREEIKAPAIGESKPLRYSLPELKEVGQIMFASGMFEDLKSVQQAMVKLLAGAELGYGPFASLRAFHVIKGKPVETSGEISARIKRSGKYRMATYFINSARQRLDPIADKGSDAFGSVVLISEKQDGAWVELEPSVFTLDDARQANLTSNPTWKSYPRNMLFARALTNAARMHCADIFGGPIYGPEELGATIVMTESGEEMAHEPQLSQEPPRRVEPKPAQPVADDKRRKDLMRDISILCNERGVSDSLQRATIDELFGEASYGEDPKTHEVKPTKTRLSVPQLEQLMQTISERTAHDSQGAA